MWLLFLQYNFAYICLQVSEVSIELLQYVNCKFSFFKIINVMEMLACSCFHWKQTSSNAIESRRRSNPDVYHITWLILWSGFLLFTTSINKFYFFFKL